MSEQFDDNASPEESEQVPRLEETFAANEEAPAEAVAGADSGQPEDGAARTAAERDEYLDALQRLQADFDNYRKRSVRQQTELLERATEGLLVQLLPVLDALDLAEAHASKEEQAALSQVGTLLRETLSRQGLERIDAVGVEFDPTVHDAVAHEEKDPDQGEEKPHEIAEVMRAGYRLKGRVVRPAMVKVKG
jgi:molecular chaperone GrpE